MPAATLYRRWGHGFLDLALLILTLPLVAGVGFVLWAVNAWSFRSLRRAFFVQERVGRGGRIFRMVKFRTMRNVHSQMAVWSGSTDELEVTRWGRFLRSSHLDELPQVWNVLWGEMSFIGPRPEMVEVERWAEEVVPGFGVARSVRPGITGLAQVMQGYVGQDAPGYRRKHELNLAYVRNVSLGLDLGILVRTAFWMLRGRGWRWEQQGRENAAAPRPASITAVLDEWTKGLREAGTSFAVLRGHRAFDDLEGVRDVDLLVAEDGVRQAERLLEEACARHGVRIHERHRSGFLRQVHVHGRRADGELEFLGVDIHTAECCYGVPFLTAAELLATVEETQPPRLAPPASALVDLLGPLLSGGVVRPDYLSRLRSVHGEDPAAVEALLMRIFGGRGTGELLPALQAGEPGAIEVRARALRRTLLRRAVLRRPAASLYGVLALVTAARIRPFFCPRGKVLAFLGTDGAGKSTLVEHVVDHLRGVYRDAPPTVLHMRPGVLPQLATVLHLGKTPYTLADMARPHRARPSGPLVSNLRVLYYWLDYVVGYFLRVHLRRRRHALVLFDRYYYDYLVDPRRSRIRPGTWLVPRLAQWVPRPDATFVCTAPADTVRARKEELPPAEVERQVREFEALAAQHGFHLVPTTGSPDEATRRVLESLYAGGGSR